MGVQVSYPGVYIEEFAPAGPITGVGTNTAAFVGIAAKGNAGTPTKITSWESFKDAFGSYPVPGFYLWHAVKGYFENGGQVCYVVRASNGTQASAELLNKDAKTLATVYARRANADVYTVDVADEPYVTSSLAVFQPKSTVVLAAGRDIQVTNAEEAAQFRPGDRIVFGGANEAGVVRVSGNVIRVDADRSAVTTGLEVALADIPAGGQTVRLLYGTGTALPGEQLVQGTTLAFAYQLDEVHVVEAVQKEYLTAGVVTYRVTLRDAFLNPLSLTSGSSVTTVEIKLVVNNTTAGTTTTYSTLGLDSAHPRYWVDVVNDDTAGPITVVLKEPPPPTPPAKQRPEAASYTLSGGRAEDLSSLDASVFIDAIAELEPVDDVNLLAVPDCLALDDASALTVQQEMIGHCERMFDRFAILDAQPGKVPFSTGAGDSIEEQRQGLDSARGYGALYYPWLKVSPPGSGDPVLVPPSGHVCGVIARSDATRGVHKAPANEIVSGALGVERSMSNVDQGQLNLQGINVIRVFGSSGRPIVWGARTTATDTNWQYVNIRRLFLFIEESIQEGIAWALFEPNNLQLWQKLKRTIKEFLDRVWRDGGLFGATAEEAYYVKIDESINPFSEQALGRLHIEIGLRPTYPAEFIIVRIGIWPGGSDVSES